MSSTSIHRATRRTSASAVLRNIRLASLFTPEDVIHQPDIDDGAAILDELIYHLALREDFGTIRQARAEVNASFATNGIRPRAGLLIPYARLEQATQPLLAIATSERGFRFGDDTVHLLALVLLPADAPGGYRQILNAFTSACPDEETVIEVARMQSPLAVWRHFDAGDHRLPDHLQARHIMDTLKAYLRADDSLRTAIDSFVKYNTPELPVLNDRQEILGVVTIKRLVRTCMPDYLMWVGDMEPFLNFEPLAEIIRNESTTWLRDIMTPDFAHVAEESPAILAMKEIGQKETLNAYVLRERRVVGIIKMLDFVKCILR